MVVVNVTSAPHWPEKGKRDYQRATEKPNSYKKIARQDEQYIKQK